MKSIFLALAALATLGLTASSALADTTATTTAPTDAKVQHAVLNPHSAQGEVQPVYGWRHGRGGWGGYYRPYYGGYGFHRPYYYGGYYRPYYYGGYYRPYYGGFYRPYYGGYWW